MVQLSTGNFVITASLFLDDQSVAIVGMDGTTGIPTWSKTMANEYQSKVSLSTFLDDEILVGSITTDSSIWLAKMNGIDGTDTWSKIYTAAVESNDEVSALIYDIHTSVLDSNVFITGKSEIEDVEYINYNSDYGKVVIGKAVNEPPPFTIGFKESGRSFMFLVISSLFITFAERSNKRECK